LVVVAVRCARLNFHVKFALRPWMVVPVAGRTPLVETSALVAVGRAMETWKYRSVAGANAGVLNVTGVAPEAEMIVAAGVRLRAEVLVALHVPPGIVHATEHSVKVTVSPLVVLEVRRVGVLSARPRVRF
jgi:hypothetical protein